MTATIQRVTLRPVWLSSVTIASGRSGRSGSGPAPEGGCLLPVFTDSVARTTRPLAGLELEHTSPSTGITVATAATPLAAEVGIVALQREHERAHHEAEHDERGAAPRGPPRPAAVSRNGFGRHGPARAGGVAGAVPTARAAGPHNRRVVPRPFLRIGEHPVRRADPGEALRGGGVVGAASGWSSLARAR